MDNNEQSVLLEKKALSFYTVFQYFPGKYVSTELSMQ